MKGPIFKREFIQVGAYWSGWVGYWRNRW